MDIEDGMIEKEEDNEDIGERESLRERSRQGLARRRQEVRSKLIFLNAAVALIVIMVVLIFKVVSLQQSRIPQAKSASTEGADVSAQERGRQQGGVAVTPVPKATAAPAQASPEGADRWIRKNLDKTKPMIALTFDDGPYTPVTKKILATLEKYQQRATFFLVCNRIPKYESSLRQAYSQGCQIASHTYGHVILTKLKKPKSIVEQVEKANREVNQVIGCVPTALRPPGGLVNGRVRKNVKMPMICWNVDSEDWKSRNVKKILRRCNSIKDGDIVLLHDLYPTTAKAVEKLVPRLKKRGFQLVTVDELFYYKGIKLKKGGVYYSAR